MYLEVAAFNMVFGGGVEMGSFKGYLGWDCICNAWRMCLLRWKRMKNEDTSSDSPPSSPLEVGGGGDAGSGEAVIEDLKTPLVKSEGNAQVKRYCSNRHAPLLRLV